MSIGIIGSKHAVYDIWPTRHKKFFILVDPGNIIGSAEDHQTSITTIRYILEKKGSVVVASSFGSLAGIPLNIPRDEREAAIEAFNKENGMGYTSFFSRLPPTKKLEVLNNVPDLLIPSTVNADQNTGKTLLFGNLTLKQKREALRAVFPKQDFAPLSTRSFVDVLKFQLPSYKIKFVSDCLRAPLHHLTDGEVLVLENLRFYQNETSLEHEERMAMAEVLASGIDVFINDSFATAHATLASSIGIPKILHHGAAGKLMDRELAFFSKFLTHPSRPIAVMIAGKRIPEKLLLIYQLLGKVDKILVAGEVALAFLAAKGLSAGANFNPTDYLVRRRNRNNDALESIPCTIVAKEILDLCAQNNVELILPVDHVVVTNPSDDRSSAVQVEAAAIPADVYAMDCGFNTINLFARIVRSCRTIFWFGTLGCTKKGYSDGSTAFAHVLASEDVVSIVGGQATCRVVHEAKVAQHISHLSSGGSSCLEVLDGGALPGVEALSDVVPPLDSNNTVSISGLLRTLPLFQGCNSHQMKAATKKFVRRVHNRGDYIVCRGDRHVRMCVVAEGGLVASSSEPFITIPPRYIGKGQTVGMYEFITQSAADETVQTAIDNTVTYHMTSSALNELLNEHPDLAAQFFQNISEPLRVIAVEEYQKQQEIGEVARRNGCRTRMPMPYGIFPSKGYLEDIIQDIIATIAFQKIKMHYISYEKQIDMSTWFVRALSSVFQRVAYHDGLGLSLTCAILRNVVYHEALVFFPNPLYASVLSAVMTTPIRLMSLGFSLHQLTFKLLVDEALTSSAVSCAPLATYAIYLYIQRKIERANQKRLSKLKQLATIIAARLLVGIVIFPVIYQRNYIDANAHMSRLFDREGFRNYQIKQVVAVFLRYVVHYILKYFNRSKMDSTITNRKNLSKK